MNMNRKISYDLQKKLGFNNFSSNLIKYILEYFPVNDFLKIKNICKNLRRIIINMNLFKEYINLMRSIGTYPKNEAEFLLKDNASFMTKIQQQNFLTEEEKMRLFQNFMYCFLRTKRYINLPNNCQIGENGFYFLSLYLTFFKCEIQIIGFNYHVISEESMAHFSNALQNTKRLTTLHLNGTNLSVECSKILGEGLAKNNSLEKLEMCYNNNFTTESVEQLLKELKFNKSIISLFFSDNLLKKEGAKIIGEYINENKMLRHLYIEKNEFGDEGMEFISMGLRANKDLEILNISENRIGSQGLLSLVEALDQSQNAENRNFSSLSLKKLYLRGNSFNNKDSSTLLGELVSNNKSLKYLDLSHNNLSDHLIKPLSEALKENISIEELILESNNIGVMGSIFLSEGMKYNKGIKILNLKNNSLGFEGAKNISDMIICNRFIQELNLQANLLDEHSIALIADKIGQLLETELKTIYMNMNQLTNINDVWRDYPFAKDIIKY